MKQTLSVDLRERIVAAYDAQERTRKEVARRFMVSVGMVKKLQAQRAKTGDPACAAPAFRAEGAIAAPAGAEAEGIDQPAARSHAGGADGLDCTVAAVHWVVTKLGLTYRKRRSMRRSKTGPMSPACRGVGRGLEGDLIRRAALPRRIGPRRT